MVEPNLLEVCLIKTILIYEIKDFIKEFQFNIIAPLINTLLFVCILSTIENYYNIKIQESSYINFLVPGIIMMVIIQLILFLVV